MKHIVIALLLQLTSANAVLAQGRTFPDVSFGIGTWRMDGGTASSSGTWISPLTFGAGWRFSSHYSVHIQYDHAGENGLTPGIQLPGVGFRFETSRGNPVGVFGSLGYHIGNFDASRFEDAVENCRPEDGCFFEAQGYRSGSIALVAGQFGTRISIASALSFELLGRINLKTGGAGGRSDDTRYSAGVGAGIAWRP